MWKFDKNIAGIFVDHAKQHIPNYDLVLDKTVDICKTKSYSSKIIDVGCATGETIRKLYSSNFKNLHGVDNSKDMIEYCPANIAKYYHSNSFPIENFDIVIMNWTLHFVQKKKEYLQDIFNNLNDDGILILSEKTSIEDFSKKFYYEYKESKGVTKEQIAEKEQSLKGVMHIDSPEWYFNTLKSIGYKNIQIFDAHWCFTSFVCFKS